MYFGTYPEFQPRQLLFGAGDAEILLLRLWMAKGNLFSGAGSFFYRSLNTSLDHPTSTTITSWVPPVPSMCWTSSTPSSAVISQGLLPCDTSSFMMQAETRQFTLPIAIAVTDSAPPVVAASLGSPTPPLPAATTASGSVALV
ncbi:hypothetical protein LWI29_031441 [Acer saccharum]|uniref:Uncharacterized protein n=1 Tax=Acer saccharum TaxID=4024 RepID=A0AA39RT02_ACESA|nr:hypothetical protein LWI29_031441 [Acer saccharum]